MEDRIVELARERERPELGAERGEHIGRAGGGAKGPRSVMVATRAARSNSTAREP